MITVHRIFTNSPDPTLLTSKDAKIVYVNPAWEKLTGYTLKEVFGKNPSILQSGKTPKKVQRKMWEALQKGQSFTSDAVIDRKKNGTYYQIRSNVYPIVENDQIKYYVQLQHDITAIKHLDTLRKEFLSATAHELKTPITVLKLLTQSHLHKAEKQGADTVKTEELQLIDKELDRLIRLIDDMLDSSRFETGKLYLQFEQINITKLIKNLLSKVRVVAKNHHIVFVKPSEDFFVIADSGRIEQVLLNLISNAVKYSPEKTTITITVKNINNYAVVSVADQGVGIPKGQQNLVFDRYYQVKAKEKRGFGLGLYIAKEIIKRHRGRIWVESIVGKGSTFFFSLPLSVQ